MIYIFFTIFIIILLIGIFLILKKIGNNTEKNDKNNTNYLILEGKYKNLSYSFAELKNSTLDKIISIDKLREENLQFISENAKLEEKAKQLIEIKDYINKFQKKYDVLSESKIFYEKQVSELKVTIEKDKAASKEKIELLNNARESLKKEFENLSNKIFETKREKFLEQNKSNLNTLLSPLKDQLKDFKNKVENIYDKETRDRVSLQKEIISLKELNIQISKDALNLTNALKGDHKTQGSWGEIILEKVLEESGLRNGHEYKTQFSTKDDDGKIKRPDAIVYLPDNKDVLIDSKLSLKNYEKYVSEDNIHDKKNYLKRFIENIKTHIKELSEKKYEDLEEIRCLDYVLMFIPIEGAFMAFLQHDRNLFSDAFQKNIVLVSPSTLLVVLKTIKTIWRYEHQNNNSKDIADRAGKLYDKFCGFVESLQSIGKYLNKAELEYENALKKLSTGRGNIVTQIENIKKLGSIKTRKSIPKEIIQEDFISNNRKLPSLDQ